MSLDFTQFRTAVRDAAEKAFTEVRAAHPDEHFYAFALYTDDGAMTVVPAANTEEGFQRKVGEDGAEANYYRWATGEWAYEAVGSKAFQAASDLLNADDRYEGEESDDEDDPAFAAFKSQVIEAMTLGLAEMEAEGFFGSGPARERVTLFVSISDSDESEMVEDASARSLNPLPVYERFAVRYQPPLG